VDGDDLRNALATQLPPKLAGDLVGQFLEIRRDVATRTLGRASPGKFVESIVQALQALEGAGQYQARPDVDGYLKGLDSRSSTLPEGLRICAARLCRAMYALRSKRSIVHKAEIDPAVYDLRLLYAGAQWVLAELLGLATGVGGDEAARLVEEVQLPVGELVEVIDGRVIVHADLTIRQELLVVLMNRHPAPAAARDVAKSMDRRSGSGVRAAVSQLWREKLIHRGGDSRIVLTEAGLRAAIEVASSHV
jgi:hypothetical protein